MRARLRVTLVRQQLAPLQVVEQGFEIVLGSGVSRELAGELFAAVLAPREEPQGPLAQGRLFFQTSAVTGGVNASGTFTPSFPRISASISAASSGFSFRNSRALS